jgi:hypothetical protein
MKIQSTTDYDQFQDIMSNREVDKHHVKRLVAAIKQQNMLHINPIVVNGKMEVIDGQHRLEAAKILKVPIHFIQDKTISKNEIAKLNSNKKNWAPIDYLNYYCVENVEPYLHLARLHNEWPFVSISTLAQLISTNKQYGGALKQFKEGNLKADNELVARRILSFADNIRNLSYDFAYDRNFLNALYKVCRIEDFSEEKFLSQLHENRMGLVKCVDEKQYVRCMEEIYNRFAKKPLRFF